jgi:hypothetical protein
MLTLPSGRRVGFSLDRFHAYLAHLEAPRARAVADSLDDPDDLLHVLDAVHFRIEDGQPYFADYVMAEWKTYAADWNTADRQALEAWLGSQEARSRRAEAIDYIKALLRGDAGCRVPYPYSLIGQTLTPEGSRMRQ